MYPRVLIIGLLLVSRIAFGGSDSFTSLFDQAQNRLIQGQYNLALDDLHSAQLKATDPAQKAQVNGLLGLAHYQMHHSDQAENFLLQALEINAGSPQQRARWTATLATIRKNRGLAGDAKRLFTEALALASNDQDLSIGIRLNQFDLLSADEKLPELLAIRELIRPLTDPAQRARYLINLGSQAKHLNTGGSRLAYESFEQARQDAGNQHPRLSAESLDGLAQLYEDQQRMEDASILNQQAIQFAKRVNARDLLLQLEWRQGRLFNHLHRTDQALSAYQLAVEHIESIRQDIPVEYTHGQSSFRATLEPIYLGLADLLLQQARQQSGEQKNQSLRRARETVELIKQSELEDYLGGRCSVRSNKNALLEAIEPQTAVLYPILLADRLELLVSIGGEIQQFSQPVTAKDLQSTVWRLAKKLHSDMDDDKPISYQLYQWLISPIEPWLRQHQVHTLVMVPDGVLRLIPPAALYDGKHYLIENYATVISPGLSLIETAPLQQYSQKILLAGISEPGPVIDNLPAGFLKAMSSSADTGSQTENAVQSRALPVDLELIDESPNLTRQLEVERLLKDSAFRQKLQEKLNLPGVAEEMAGLHQLIPNTLLMNEDFTVDRFNRQALQEPYSVVHIASHGVFGKSADTSFIMAYDDVINLNDLERLLSLNKFAKQPVELLTLSACQTAEGDDRSPLGLSGIAIKAKVRSALGSLWPVNDQAASRLMTEFYKALATPGTSKAQALRQAQIALLEQAESANPYYWSPFILVGNWL
ncbi:MAG: CHAT domain-containing protein [Methylomonas sp.]|nr:CHAT domain-containing protein [Methylomonas sp.]